MITLSPLKGVAAGVEPEAGREPPEGTPRETFWGIVTPKITAANSVIAGAYWWARAASVSVAVRAIETGGTETVRSFRAQTRIAPIAAVTLFALVVTASATAAPPPRSFYGVAPQTDVTSTQIDRMGQGNVGALRIVINWPSVDPTPAVADYDWSAIDRIVADSARNGIQVLPSVWGTPAWVAQGIDGKACTTTCASFAPRSPLAVSAWSTFLVDVVGRYGTNGQFWAQNPGLPAMPITAWQVWNEQNSPVFFKPRPDVKAYAGLVGVSAQAIRGVDPNAEVILGGMAELAGVKTAIAGSSYLRRFYGVKGAKATFDGVAAHPYGAKLSRVREQVELIREVMRRGHDSAADLWVTEIGWGSARGSNPLNRGPRGQAQRLAQAYRYFAANRRRLNVRSVSWFSWQDSATSICAWCATSGLFTTAFEPKPAWRAFTKLTGGS